MTNKRTTVLEDTPPTQHEIDKVLRHLAGIRPPMTEHIDPELEKIAARIARDNGLTPSVTIDESTVLKPLPENPLTIANEAWLKLLSLGLPLTASAKAIIEEAVIRARQRSAIESKEEADLLLDAMEAQAQRRQDQAVLTAIGACMLHLGKDKLLLNVHAMGTLFEGHAVTAELSDCGQWLTYTLAERTEAQQ